MPSPEEAIARAGCPERLAAPLVACMLGNLPVNVALMRLLVESADQGETERLLARLEREVGPETRAGARLVDLSRLWRANPDAWSTVRGVLAAVAHDRPPPLEESHSLAALARDFDRAAALSPDASAALYALGDPELLRRATDEVVGCLRDWGLLHPGRVVLDLGCGSGRLLAALAPHVTAAVGTDISAGMLRAARARMSAANVLPLQVSGRALACLADRRFDLVLAVDAFPYLVQAGEGLAPVHVAEAARVLKSGGDLVILNYSYRGDPAVDRSEVAALAEQHGFALVRAGERPFALWDGLAFHLRRACGALRRL